MRRCSVTSIRRSWTGLADAGQTASRELGSPGRRRVSIEERAGAAGASARSLSWLLPSGGVRHVPDVASGMPSRAGDPISSPGSLLFFDRWVACPTPRWTSGSWAFRTSAPSSGTACQPPMAGSRARPGSTPPSGSSAVPARRMSSAMPTGPTWRPCSMAARTDPRRRVPAAVSSRIAAGTLYFLSRPARPRRHAWSTGRATGFGGNGDGMNLVRVLAMEEQRRSAKREVRCCRFLQWRSARWR